MIKHELVGIDPDVFGQPVVLIIMYSQSAIAISKKLNTQRKIYTSTEEETM